MKQHPPRHRFTPSGQLQLGIFFQGVNSGTVWKTAESGSQTDFESFRRIAQTAERGLFAAFFLGEGLRLREHLGRPHALDVVGRPDAQTMLAALAAVTTSIGLVATQNTTYNDPADLAHRLSTLDLLSGGRAAWNIVTTDNAWTGANFRRGGYLDHADRYVHAEAFVETAKRIWDAWDDGAIATPAAAAGGRRTARSGGCATKASTTRWTSRPGCRAAPSTGRCCSRPATRPRAATSPPARPTSSSPRTRSSTTPWSSAATSWSARSRPAGAPTT